ncbi:MAG: protoporphyrinogen oxidase [Candidatus Deianiraeaceae bacterium]|jgi:protoporphyrinogen oxidase
MKINIVGAGISGLALGYFFKKAGYDVHIYEASSKAGGIISTEFMPEGMVQHGPHLVRSNNTLKVLLHELNIKTTPLLCGKKYISNAENNFQVGFPLTFSETLKAVLLQLKKRKPSYKSLADFTNHHYGTAFTTKILQCIVNGVYATSAANLDAKIAFKGLYFTEKRGVYHTFKVLFRKIYSKNEGIIAPMLGFKSLINALSSYLHANISYNTKITDISPLEGKVFITIPTFHAKKLLGISDVTHQKLENITYSNLDITTVFTKTAYTKQGIGMLTNAHSGVLGVLFNSSSFQGRVTQSLHSYSVFSKNMTQKQVEDFCINTSKVLLQKSYFKSYYKAIPIYNSAIREFIKYNSTLKTKYRFFSNYTGNSALGKIIEEAQTLVEGWH